MTKAVRVAPMASRRPDSTDESRAKRVKTTDMNPKLNPYLAHHYDESSGYNNGWSGDKSNGNGSSDKGTLGEFKRHKTTAAQAEKVENGPQNPFNGKPLSQQYFSILHKRRDLPVHKQRYVA